MMATVATPDTARCFPPVISPHTRLLILGSLPGKASLAAGRYYAHPRNQFWLLLQSVLQQPLAALDYAARLQTLLTHGVGLWDVVAQARRHSSLDSDIRNAEHNDLRSLLQQWPTIRAVAFNGQTAGRAARQLPMDLPFTILPSSSPALTLPLAKKQQCWQDQLLPLLHPG